MMNISRRRFVKTGMIVAATAFVPLGLAKTAAAQQSNSLTSGIAPNKAQTNGSFYYNRSTFAPYVNSEFRVHLNSSKAVAITLMGIEDFSNSQETLRAVEGECFTLQFSGAPRRAFTQKTYEVEHAALGRFSLFIVPVGMRTSKGEVSYEAIFNRPSQISVLPSASFRQKPATRNATTK